MVEKLLLDYKLLLKKREEALLKLDSETLEEVLKAEERLLDKLEAVLRNVEGLSPVLKPLAEEVYILHEKVAKLTYSVVEILMEDGSDEHFLNV